MAAIIRFDLDISKMTVQGGGCTTVVVPADGSPGSNFDLRLMTYDF